MTAASSFADGPLSGIRVIEMGVLLAAPFCGQLLADYGAEVIKVEEPGKGDPMRQWGREMAEGQSLWWPVVSRNKKSVEINLRTPAGQAAVKRLVADSDMVLENFRPGTLERWGLGYEELRAINPGIILIRVTGFGQTGPYAKQAGYGSIGEAMGGLRYITGDPSTPPSRVGISIGDSLAGTFAAMGALLALHVRERTGTGQVVDSAIFEAVLAMMEAVIPEYQVAGHTRERSGAILPNVAPSNVYPTSDGEDIVIGANQDSVFRRLAEAMGQPELAADERYSTHLARGANQAELDERIASWTRTLDAKELLEVLSEHGVPTGRMFRAADMLDDPHFKAREDIVTVPHPDFGQIAMQAVMPKMSGTPGRVRWPGPALGAHNDEVLGGLLGLDPQEMQAVQSSA